MRPRVRLALVLLASVILAGQPAPRAFAATVRGAPSPTPPSAPAAPQRQAPRGVRYVYLIRHGMYDRVDSLDDRVANGLSRLGHEQAMLLAERLAALPVKARLLVSSDFTRARETADDIAGVLGMKAERDTLIEECSPPSDRPGQDRGRDSADVSSCEAKLRSAWEKYFRPSPEADAHDLLVCHGNVIRWFVNRAMGNDVRRWASMDIGNASLTIIAVRADGTTHLVMYSDVGHLPPEKQTWLGRGPGWGKRSP